MSDNYEQWSQRFMLSIGEMKRAGFCSASYTGVSLLTRV